MHFKFPRLAFLALTLACSWAHAEFVVEITKGQTEAIPIAVVPFASAELTAASFDVAQLVSDDLARSARFKTMDRKDMIEQPHTGANIAFDDWRRLNNDYMVVGSMQPDGTDHFNITYELYNVLTRQRLLGFQISSNRAGLRSAGHQVADAVFEKILGIRGAFSTRIAYISVLGHLPNKTFQLIVADADGENPHVVMQSHEPLMSPSWSPDGSSLAYVSFEERLPSVYVQTLKTGDRRRVSSHAGVNQAPSWSPDGKKLALVLSTRDGNLDVYILELASQQLTRITDDPGIDTEPQWSKDGQSLYFTSDRAGGPQIYKVGIRPGDKPRRLTFQGAYNARPRVSPDESQLAFVTQENGDYRIATMDLRGRGDVQVLTKGHFDVSPSYAPNGAVLIYATRDKGRGVLALVSADGRVQQRLVSSDGELQEPAWAPF
ncbi:MAG TPA: Tol-Pal system beta propeller repeat protein TolB [Steroidobacteraceae bacterium]|jgi:TolB protein|nr:Tol-Pal system beta propeller repeat protein TolB [Steroidobacteraceae bacterium]